MAIHQILTPAMALFLASRWVMGVKSGSFDALGLAVNRASSPRLFWAMSFLEGAFVLILAAYSIRTLLPRPDLIPNGLLWIVPTMGLMLIVGMMIRVYRWIGSGVVDAAGDTYTFADAPGWCALIIAGQCFMALILGLGCFLIAAGLLQVPRT